MEEHFSFSFDCVDGRTSVHVFTREGRAFLKRWHAVEGTKAWLRQAGFISLNAEESDRFYAQAKAKFGVTK